MHSFLPSSILFQLGPVVVHWYGLLVVSGFLAGLGILLYLFKRYGLKRDEAYNLFFYCIIFGLIGARIYYILYDWSYYSQNLVDIFKVWQGGLAIHGAIIAALITIYFYSRKKGWSFWLITDMVATCVPLSMAIGRWGNYFNQELFGKPTNLPWGIPIALANRPAEYVSYTYFHPTFLYESILDLVLFGILMVINLKKFGNRKSEIGLPAQAGNRKSEIKEGNITLGFLLGYAVIRFGMEFLRTDYSPVVFGIRWAQLFSVLLAAAVVVIWIIGWRRGRRG